MSAYLAITDALRGSGFNVVERSEGKAAALCPAHDDSRPSLSIGPRRDGKGVVIYCHAGCAVGDVLAKIGLAQRDLFDEPEMRNAYSDTNTYTYRGGRKVHRGAGKKFFQSGNVGDTSLFGVEHVTAECDRVYVVEGEKDVLAALGVGAVAVCPAMGAGKAAKFDWSPLAGHHVVVVADRDEPGRKHARQVVELLDDLAAKVEVKEPCSGKDLADHLAAGHGLDELVDVTGGTEDDGGHDDGRIGSDGWLSDANVSELFVERVLRGKYCYSPGLGWLRFDGKKWCRVAYEDVTEKSRKFARKLLAEQVTRGASSDKIRAYTKRLSAGAVRACAELAKGQLLIAADEFDTHPDLLNVGNGVVDLRTGKLQPHDAALLLTKCAPAHYRPGAEHADWSAALAPSRPRWPTGCNSGSVRRSVATRRPTTFSRCCRARAATAKPLSPAPSRGQWVSTPSPCLTACCWLIPATIPPK